MAFALRRPLPTTNVDMSSHGQTKAQKYRALNGAGPPTKWSALTDVSIEWKLRGIYCNCQNQPVGRDFSAGQGQGQ